MQKCLENVISFGETKKKSTEQSRLDIYRDHSKFKSKDKVFLIQFLRFLINHSI